VFHFIKTKHKDYDCIFKSKKSERIIYFMTLR